MEAKTPDNKPTVPATENVGAPHWKGYTNRNQGAALTQSFKLYTVYNIPYTVYGIPHYAVYIRHDNFWPNFDFWTKNVNSKVALYGPRLTCYFLLGCRELIFFIIMFTRSETLENICLIQNCEKFVLKILAEFLLGHFRFSWVFVCNNNSINRLFHVCFQDIYHILTNVALPSVGKRYWKILIFNTPTLFSPID